MSLKSLCDFDRGRRSRQSSSTRIATVLSRYLVPLTGLERGLDEAPCRESCARMLIDGKTARDVTGQHATFRCKAFRQHTGRWHNLLRNSNMRLPPTLTRQPQAQSAEDQSTTFPSGPSLTTSQRRCRSPKKRPSSSSVTSVMFSTSSSIPLIHPSHSHRALRS